MTCIWVQKVSAVLLINLFQNRRHHFYKLTILRFKAHYVQSTSDGIDSLNIGYASFFAFDIERQVVGGHKSAQNRLYFSSYLISIQNRMQIYSLDIFADLIHVLFSHDSLILLDHLIMLQNKALDSSIELMSFVKKALQYFNAKIFANLENVLVLTNKFTEHRQVRASSSVLLQKVT